MSELNVYVAYQNQIELYKLAQIWIWLFNYFGSSSAHFSHF